jgi:hypothetical protein
MFELSTPMPKMKAPVLKSARFTGWQIPDEHVPPRQLCPQVPQLSGSVCVLVHDVPQAVSPAGHSHAALVHPVPLVQTQLLPSRQANEVTLHSPAEQDSTPVEVALHVVCPGAHSPAHTPLWQVVFVQSIATVPHAPAPVHVT